MEARKAFSAEAEDRLALDPGRNVDPTRPVEGRHLDLGTKGRGVRRDGHVEDEIISLAHESIVRPDVDDDVQVPGGPARLPGQSAAGNPQLDAIWNAGRNLDRDRSLIRNASLAGATPTGRLGPLPPTVAP